MEADEQKLESLLKGMTPSGLDPELMGRLEMAVSGRLQQPDVSLSGMQAKLRDLKPATPREELREQLAGVVEGVPFPVDEKVVLFPRGGRAEAPSRRSPRPWVAAAAAVALLGALSAFLVSPGDDSPQKVAETRATPTAPRVERGSFVPATYGSDVSDTRDLGVGWIDESRPMRVMQVHYMDKVSFLNEKGDRVEVEVPRTEYVVVPEKID